MSNMNFGSNMRLNKVGLSVIAVFVLFLIMYSVKNNNGDCHDKIPLRKLLTEGISAAVAGGNKVYAIFNSSHFNTKSKGKTKEGANDPLTDADILSHCVMYHGLLHTFPGVKIISEEQTSKCENLVSSDLLPSKVVLPDNLPDTLVSLNDITIWIDPLDATQEFTEKLVEYVTTMVCVAVKGVPTLGIINFPFSNTTIWAWYGHGSNIAPNEVQDKLIIITSRSHKGELLSSLITRAVKDKHFVVEAGGAGYKSVQIASGNATVYIHITGIKKWDICAGDAVLRSIGGKMTSLLGEEIIYNSSTDHILKNGVIASLDHRSELVKRIINVSHY